MFWKRKKVTVRIDQLGLFEWYDGTWVGQIDKKGDDFTFCIEGEISGPGSSAVTKAKSILENIEEVTLQATNYLEEIDISHFTESAGKLKVCGATIKQDTSYFDLEFYLTEWKDAFVIVHFKNDIPYELSLGD